MLLNNDPMLSRVNIDLLTCLWIHFICCLHIMGSITNMEKVINHHVIFPLISPAQLSAILSNTSSIKSEIHSGSINSQSDHMGPSIFQVVHSKL